jgi:hypothetical protein
MNIPHVILRGLESLLGPLPVNRVAVPSKVLKVDDQVYDEWCWAELGAAIYRFYCDRDFNKFDIATLFLTNLGGTADCFKKPDACQGPQPFEDVLGFTGNSDGPPTPPLSPAQLAKLDLVHKPIAVRMRWEDQTSPVKTHVVGVRGFLTACEKVQVEDSWNGSGDVDFDVFAGSYLNMGSWTDTFSTQAGSCKLAKP